MKKIVNINADDLKLKDQSVFILFNELVGTVKIFAGNVIPDGWLLCDGSELSRETYVDLFNVIGTTWGEGDGSTTFNLPNSIGRFAEGADNAGGYKEAGLPNITGAVGGVRNDGASITPSGVFNVVSYAGQFGPGTGQLSNVDFDASRSSTIYGNSDTVQPNSFTVRYIIKY